MDRYPNSSIQLGILGIVFFISSCAQTVPVSPPAPPTVFERTAEEARQETFAMRSAMAVGEFADAMLTDDSRACLTETAIIKGRIDQFEVFVTTGAEFPTDANSYVVMSSGDASVVAPNIASTFSSITYGSNEGVVPVPEGGSPNGYTTHDRATLRLNMTIPENATTLMFDWKFGSEEPPTHATTFDSKYQDYFSVVVDAPTALGMNKTVLRNISINGANVPGGSSGSPAVPLPSPNNTIYNSVTPGIQTAMLDVTPYQGMTVTIDFHVADASDSQLDSGVFLDNVRFDASCEKDRYEYVAKVVCGTQEDRRDFKLAPGAYATAINVHNPNKETVTFFKKLALTYPPEEQRAGKIHPIAFDRLKYDEALAVDCGDISREVFQDSFPLTGDFFEGFVVIQSPASLDVTGVYTVSSLQGEVRSMDVEQIKERVTQDKMPDPPTTKKKELDHFKIYALDTLPTQIPVYLEGQFDADTSKEAGLPRLTHFANPARKIYMDGTVGSEIKDTTAHFTIYDIEQPQPEPAKIVTFTNQFGVHKSVVTRARKLFVPAQKLSDPGSIFPDSLDFYKCYAADPIEVPELPRVTLEDQFEFNETVNPQRLVMFCVPVVNTSPNAPAGLDLNNPADHLAIYQYDQIPSQVDIEVQDKFDTHGLGILEAVYMAVPSNKESWVIE